MKTLLIVCQALAMLVMFILSIRMSSAISTLQRQVGKSTGVQPWHVRPEPKSRSRHDDILKVVRPQAQQD